MGSCWCNNQAYFQINFLCFEFVSIPWQYRHNWVNTEMSVCTVPYPQALPVYANSFEPGVGATPCVS